MRSVPRLAGLALSVALLVVGCGGDEPKPPGRGNDSPSTALAEAVGRVAGSGSAPTLPIAFSGSEALRRSSTFTDPLQPVAGVGLGSLYPLRQDLPSTAGIDIGRASYAVTAGSAPDAVGLLAGGQDGTGVTSRLLDTGWEQDGPVLRRPREFSKDVAATRLGLVLSQVRVTGEDVVYGTMAADLATVKATGSPASDLMPLLQCLGEVTAAQVDAPQADDQGARLAAVGVVAAMGGGALRSILCTTWASADAATAAAAAQRQDVMTGKVAGGKPYSELLSDATVEDLRGAGHVVRLTATPNKIELLFTMLSRGELPG